MTSATQILTRLPIVLIALAVACAGTAGPVMAGEKFCKQDRYYVRDGDVEVGDAYMFAQSITVTGTHDGDLIGFSPATVINGVVTGDVMIMGQTLDISGVVHDTVRVWTQGLTITGTVDGDVVFFGSHVTIHPNAHIKGSLIGLGGTAIVDGIIERGVQLTVGQANLHGDIRGDVVVRADAISLSDDLKIDGDLRYTARKELEFENPEAVTGEIIFTEKEKKDQSDGGGEPEPFITTWSVLWFAWRVISLTLIGFVLLALGGGTISRLMEPIRSEPMMGALIGFGSCLVVPAACFLAFLMIISIPLGVVVLTIFGITLYLAKLPVALWIGDRLLSAIGMPAASPFLALAIGVLLLYLVFAIPFYVGMLALLVVTWLGLGTIILAIRSRFTAAGELASGQA